jgi:hypothetical protein
MTEMKEAERTDIDLVDVRYYSKNDEHAFFDWLRKIKCVTKVHGHRNILTITIINDLDEDGLRDLIALFYRYRIDMKPLAQFDRPEFREWLHYRRAYWYSKMFAPGDS